MPKFTPFKMSESDYTELETVASGHNLGGLCVAISVEWLERIYKDKPLPASFAEEKLEALAEQQLTYFRLAEKASGDTGFIDYCRSRGFAAKKIESGKADYGEIEDFEKVILESNTGYILSFSETDIGARKAHVIALYRNVSTGQSAVEIRDQNIGQMEVSNEAELLAEYQKVMAGHYAEYKQEYDEAKKNSSVKVTRPHYRRWVLYKVTG